MWGQKRGRGRGENEKRKGEKKKRKSRKKMNTFKNKCRIYKFISVNRHLFATQSLNKYHIPQIYLRRHTVFENLVICSSTSS